MEMRGGGAQTVFFLNFDEPRHSIVSGTSHDISKFLVHPIDIGTGLHECGGAF